MKSVPLFKKLMLLLDPATRISTGVMPDDKGRYGYVVCAINRKNEPHIIAGGDDLLSRHFAMPPIAVRTALQHETVYYVSNDLNGDDPDAWLDKNEKKVIPPGFTADQVEQEWDVVDNTIHSAVLTKPALEGFLTTVPQNRLLLRSLSIPLWDIALLYARYISGDFVLWKITAKGSQLGYVRNGRLYSLCFFWPDADDLRKEPDKSGKEIAGVVRSLTAGNTVTGIYQVVHHPLQKIPEPFYCGNYKLCPLPVIENIPAHLHEAYSCALHADTPVDFAPIGPVQQAKRLEKNRRTLLRYMRALYAGACGLFLLVIVSTGIVAGAKNFIRGKTAPLQKYIRSIAEGEKRLDSLKVLCGKKAFFIGRESFVTFLLNEFQTVFPNGLWAEQIEIYEAGDGGWQVSCIALSYSTALVPQFLSALEKIEGIHHVRMIYSEQTKLENKELVTRFKIECMWNR
jgi:hypothetical protein